MRPLNIAEQILDFLGCPLRTHGDKSPSFTKKGPGRKHRQGGRRG